MSRPSKITAPKSASTTPEMALSSVDLPAPLVPEQRHDLALADLHRHVEEDLHRPVEHVEVADQQQLRPALPAEEQRLGAGGRRRPRVVDVAGDDRSARRDHERADHAAPASSATCPSGCRSCR